MLNEKQKELYRFLLLNSERYQTKEEICESLKELYPRYLEKSTEQNSWAFRELRRDVETINKEPNNLIIVTGSKGYKIATQEEAIAFKKRKRINALKALKRYWSLEKKYQDDSQLAFKDDGFIEEVKSFMRGEENGK